MKGLLSLLLLNSLVFITLNAQRITPAAKPEEAGFSSQALKNLDLALQNWVDEGLAPGFTALVVRDGKIAYYKSFGYDDIEKKTSLEKDAIYRIASQTKAITSVGIMILHDEGKLQLNDPISKYIPAFKNPVVLDKFNAADTTYTTIKAKKEITVRELLNHTSGIGYAQIGSPESNAIYAKHGITSGIGPSDSLQIVVNRLAKLPLLHNPGERWTYGLNSDVLGALIEIISGMSLDEFFKTRIFQPLGMNDSYFRIPEQKHSRLVKLYKELPGNKYAEAVEMVLNNKTDGNYPLRAHTYYSGGAGLSASIMDYGIFLQMLLNGGIYNGNRIIGRNSVRMMVTNQIGNIPFGGRDRFGLGFQLVTDSSSGQSVANVGTFSWGGAFATSYWVDPKEKMVILFYRQLWGSTHGDVVGKFRALVYQALLD